ncbi:MAG: hypothetical protein SWQ30_19670 [Thermodesulfobacteriota bacterium]|nr:hypothetical protein [Thermodesulfobacteriota bacterium]
MVTMEAELGLRPIGPKDGGTKPLKAMLRNLPGLVAATLGQEVLGINMVGGAGGNGIGSAPYRRQGVKNRKSHNGHREEG